MTSEITQEKIFGDYTPTAEVAEFLKSLLELKASAKVAVIDSDSDVSRILEKAGYSVTRIPDDGPLDEQIKQLKLEGPFDGAIVMPIFSSVQSDVPPPEGWGELKKTFREDWVLAYAINQLKPTGRLVALVPNGMLSNYGRLSTRQGLIDRGLTLVASIPQLLLSGLNTHGTTGLIVLYRENIDPERQITFVDCAEDETLRPREFWNRLQKDHNLAEMRVVYLKPTEITGDLRLDPQYYDPAYLQIKPPLGFIETELSDVAEIYGGYAVGKELREENKPTDGKVVPYLQVRHITPEGVIAQKVNWVRVRDVPNYQSRLAHPGDLLVTIAGTVGKVAIVPDQFKEGVLFDTSLRRVQINNTITTPQAVYKFLVSEIGQLQFRRRTGGTGIPQITTPVLKAMPIFLAEHSNEPLIEVEKSPIPHEVIKPPVQAEIIANAIEERVVKYLRNLGSEDTNWPENIDKVLQELTKNLIPKPLDRLILEDFPALISIPYRRYMMARFNHYERLDRMISLVESCIYFVFHVLLADYLKNDWHRSITLSADAKSAIKGRQSIDYRLKFIDEILNAAQANSVSLFVPELINCDIVRVGDLFRLDVRNPTAHSAPGSESYIQSVIHKYESEVENLLNSLKFLRNFTVCRIRSHFYRNQQWYYHAEFYRGAEYDVNIQESSISEVEEEVNLIPAEREHLVLLSADGETLDLHPFYQLYFGDETCRESHLCFAKYWQDDRAIGESIRSSLEVPLLDVEAFRRIRNLSASNSGMA